MSRYVIQRWEPDGEGRLLVGFCGEWVSHPISAKWFASVPDALDAAERELGQAAMWWIRELADDCCSLKNDPR
jgi:hypothetical protein